jgi:hypothetical protein
MNRMVWRSSRIAILCCLLATSSSEIAAGKALLLSVHLNLPVSEIHSRVAPRAELLSRGLGRPVDTRLGGNNEVHMSCGASLKWLSR